MFSRLSDNIVWTEYLWFVDQFSVLLYLYTSNTAFVRWTCDKRCSVLLYDGPTLCINLPNCGL